MKDKEEEALLTREGSKELSPELGVGYRLVGGSLLRCRIIR